MSEPINHGYAELLAQEVKYRMEAAREALENLEKALREVETGPKVGVIPGEVFASYLFDYQEMPLSVTLESAEVLILMAKSIAEMLASVTETIRLNPAA